MRRRRSITKALVALFIGDAQHDPFRRGICSQRKPPIRIFLAHHARVQGVFANDHWPNAALIMSSDDCVYLVRLSGDTNCSETVFSASVTGAISSSVGMSGRDGK